MKPKLHILALLCGFSVAFAQSGTLPDAAACAVLVAPQPRPMSAAFGKAVRATAQAYISESQPWLKRVARRPLTVAEDRELQRLIGEASGYAARALAAYGWPEDAELRATPGPLLGQAKVQWCAGQVALNAARSLAERTQAASLIDQALTGFSQKQRYGSVYSVSGRKVEAMPIDDEANVDTRRAELGLPPLAEALARAQTELPPRAAPVGLLRPVVLHAACEPFTTPAALNTPLSEAQLDKLEAEAAQLVEQDQASRKGEAGAREMREVDAESTAWLKSVLREFGWPSANRADEQLAFNAWLLAQHADAAPSLQACALDLIGQQRTTQAEEQHFAYLTDRVRIAQGQPQLYGTQVTYDEVQRRASLMSLQDPEHVNERRAQIGLGSIEEYLKGFEPPQP
ncbi:DUF6624 domain-containing protein [Deinococcus sp.]|uniref:DUF6624 domain-containing protein n=1 Tax=Deinococcus sp. TaxID=47478 RepID=UPI003B5B1831